jgi:hypothetical protein
MTHRHVHVYAYVLCAHVCTHTCIHTHSCLHLKSTTCIHSHIRTDTFPNIQLPDLNKYMYIFSFSDQRNARAVRELARPETVVARIFMHVCNQGAKTRYVCIYAHVHVCMLDIFIHVCHQSAKTRFACPYSLFFGFSWKNFKRRKRILCLPLASKGNQFPQS